MKSIERRIIRAIAGAKREGLEPKSLYLTPADLEELDSTGAVDQVGGLPLKRARSKSRLFCRHGIERAIPVERRRTRDRPL